MGSINIRMGHFEKSETIERRQTEKGGEETSENCEELEGKSQVLL